MGIFRVAKSFEVEYGHRLSKHPEKCRFPHGHRLRIEVVVRGTRLDANDMVCDYKALKLVVLELVERLDHAMAVSSSDPEMEAFARFAERLLVFEDEDPTTEVLARWLYNGIAERLVPGRSVRNGSGVEYSIPEDLAVERVRVWETSTSWAEYAGSDG